MTPPWTKEGFFFCFYLFCSGSLKCRSRLSPTPKCSHWLRQMKLVPITTSDQETLRIILMFKSCINYLLHDFHDDAFTSAPSRLWLPHIHSFHVFEPCFYSICSVDAVLNTTILIVCTSVCRWQLYSMLSLLYQTVFYFFFYCTFSKDSALTFTVNPMAVGCGSICASITCFVFFSSRRLLHRRGAASYCPYYKYIDDDCSCSFLSVLFSCITGTGLVFSYNFLFI